MRVNCEPGPPYRPISSYFSRRRQQRVATPCVEPSLCDHSSGFLLVPMELSTESWSRSSLRDMGASVDHELGKLDRVRDVSSFILNCRDPKLGSYDSKLIFKVSQSVKAGPGMW